MMTTVMVVSLILTVIVLILTLVTISQGYGYKHTIDPIKEDESTTSNDHNESEIK